MHRRRDAYRETWPEGGCGSRRLDWARRNSTLVTAQVGLPTCSRSADGSRGGSPPTFRGLESFPASLPHRAPTGAPLFAAAPDRVLGQAGCLSLARARLGTRPSPLSFSKPRAGQPTYLGSFLGCNLITDPIHWKVSRRSTGGRGRLRAAGFRARSTAGAFTPPARVGEVVVGLQARPEVGGRPASGFHAQR